MQRRHLPARRSYPPFCFEFFVWVKNAVLLFLLGRSLLLGGRLLLLPVVLGHEPDGGEPLRRQLRTLGRGVKRILLLLSFALAALVVTLVRARARLLTAPLLLEVLHQDAAVHGAAPRVARPGKRRLRRRRDRLQHVDKLRAGTLGKLAQLVHALPVRSSETVGVPDLHDVLDALLALTLRRLPHRPRGEVLDEGKVVASHAGAVRLEDVASRRVRVHLV